MDSVEDRFTINNVNIKKESLRKAFFLVFWIYKHYISQMLTYYLIIFQKRVTMYLNMILKKGYKG